MSYVLHTAHPQVCYVHERSKRYHAGRWRCPECPSDMAQPRRRRTPGGGEANGWTSSFRDACTRAGARYKKKLDANVRVLCKGGVWLVPPPPDLVSPKK